MNASDETLGNTPLTTINNNIMNIFNQNETKNQNATSGTKKRPLSDAESGDEGNAICSQRGPDENKNGNPNKKYNQYRRTTTETRPKFRQRKNIKTKTFLDHPVNTVLFKLKEDAFAKINEMENLLGGVEGLLGVKLKEVNLKEKRLYVTPLTEDDHDEIIRSNKINSFQTQTLPNKDRHLILKVSYNEIEESQKVKENLLNMGIESWEPLINDGSVESRDDQKVRCKCKSRTELSNILLKYFKEGRRFLLKGNLSTDVTFHSESKMPVQCFNCHSYDGHKAENCTRKTVCPNCCNKNRDIETKTLQTTSTLDLMVTTCNLKQLTSRHKIFLRSSTTNYFTTTSQS